MGLSGLIGKASLILGKNVHFFKSFCVGFYFISLFLPFCKFNMSKYFHCFKVLREGKNVLLSLFADMYACIFDVF